jgi:hypothetical protein
MPGLKPWLTWFSGGQGCAWPEDGLFCADR